MLMHDCTWTASVIGIIDKFDYIIQKESNEQLLVVTLDVGSYGNKSFGNE